MSAITVNAESMLWPCGCACLSRAGQARFIGREAKLEGAIL
jgi:hypothetical protein